MVSTSSLSLPTPLAVLGPTDALSMVKRVLVQLQSHTRTLLLPSAVVGCVAILEGSTKAHADAWAGGAHRQALSELLSQVMLLSGTFETPHTYRGESRAIWEAFLVSFAGSTEGNRVEEEEHIEDNDE